MEQLDEKEKELESEEKNEIEPEDEKENVSDEEKSDISEAGGDKKLTPKELEKLDNEICLNICWCSHHKCKEDDKYNNCMGLDLKYMMKFWGERNVEKRYKCENCEFDSAEMEDVKKHFM